MNISLGFVPEEYPMRFSLRPINKLEFLHANFVQMYERNTSVIFCRETAYNDAELSDAG